MNLPKPKIPVSLPTIFPLETLSTLEKPITKAAARNWTGDFYEQATANLTHATRLRTNSNHRVCPDLQFRPRQRIFFESKAIGNTKRAIIYEHRWHKDQHFLRRNQAKLFYFFWSHCCHLKHLTTPTAIQSSLAKFTLRLYILSTAELIPIIATLPKRVLNTALIKSGPNAGKRLGYGKRSSSNGQVSNITGGIGWSIPLRSIKSVCTNTFYPFQLQVYHTTIHDLIVSTGKPDYQRFIT